MQQNAKRLIETNMTFTRRAWMEIVEYRRSFPTRDGKPMPIGVALDRLLWTHPALVAIREARVTEIHANEVSV